MEFEGLSEERADYRNRGLPCKCPVDHVMLALILRKESMSSNYRPEHVEPTWKIQEYRRDHDGPRRHLPPHAYEQPARPPPHPEAEDVASVLGLPAHSITPEILAALMPLLAELDRLHWLVEQSERRLAWHEGQSDRHSVVACLTRRALVRDLDAFLGSGDSYGTLAVVQVTGVEILHQFHGLAAGDAAMRHIAGNILGALRASDLVGCLGGSDFAIVLPGTETALARPKLEQICARIAEPPFHWDGQIVALTASFGLHALQADFGAEQALMAADRARRGVE